MAAHHSLGTLPIYLFGSEEQKREWIPELASGEKLAAFGLTEAEPGPMQEQRARGRSSRTASGSSTARRC